MSPKTKEQNEIIRSQSRTNIMQTALELFAHNGYHNTSIAQIAKEAKVSKGLLYNYFESKEAMLQRIVMECINIGEDIFAQLHTELEPKVQLQNLIEATFNTFLNNLDYYKLIASLSFQADVLKDFESTIVEKTNQFLAQLEEIFEKMNYENVALEAKLFVAIMDGVTIHFMKQKEYPIEDVKHFLIKKYCS